MATVSSREGVIAFAAVGDATDTSSPSARIYSIVVIDPDGASSATLNKVTPDGSAEIFRYEPNGTAGTYPFYFYGTITTGTSLSFDGSGTPQMYVYIR